MQPEVLLGLGGKAAILSSVFPYLVTVAGRLMAPRDGHILILVTRSHYTVNWN